MEKKMRLNIFNTGRSVIFTAVVIAMITGLNITFAADDKITIYGSKDCYYCIKMTKWLDEKQIPYEFNDVTLSEDVSARMREAVVNANYKTTYYYPVMMIKGQLVMRPSTVDVEKALTGENIRGLEERLYKEPSWRMEYPKSMKYSYDSIRSMVKDEDVTIYDNNSAAGKKMMAELRANKVPFKYIEVQMSGTGFTELRGKLDKSGFGPKTVLPVVDIRGRMIMKAVRSDDVILMLIEIIGD